MAEKLYVWADLIKSPLRVSLDHTWVSSYKPNDSAPSPRKGDYWYCWGKARDHAILLREGVGGGDFARTIATPHDKNANAGIEYRKDGVCHQIANRLLRFSFDENYQPVTVKGAKGSVLSNGMYGTYGDKNQLTRSQKDRVKAWEDVVRKYEKHMSGDGDE